MASENFDDAKYLDMAVCHQIFALHENRRRIDVFNRHGFCRNQKIKLDRLYPQPKKSPIYISVMASG